MVRGEAARARRGCQTPIRPGSIVPRMSSILAFLLVTVPLPPRSRPLSAPMMRGRVSRFRLTTKVR
jgi:hypothetical protein